MLKKTTVYLSEDDLRLLRKKAAIQDVTVAEAIRISIQTACKPSSKDEQLLWDSLDRIWAKSEALEEEKIQSVVGKAVKEVRGAKKARRRS
ncbi:MAG: hypothetical protein HYW49_00210 [Deltaproteobacteria bacterium]|nr:hypothetical protein [Deltaproteobacteria bacterium]